jgi:hypothetical protein
MTKSSVAVSVKIPARILERIPPPGQGRSGFIVQAIEEKLARNSRRHGNRPRRAAASWLRCSNEASASVVRISRSKNWKLKFGRAAEVFSGDLPGHRRLAGDMGT